MGTRTSRVLKTLKVNLVTGDADDIYDFTLIPQFLAPLEGDGCDFVTGSHSLGVDGGRAAADPVTAGGLPLGISGAGRELRRGEHRLIDFRRAGAGEIPAKLERTARFLASHNYRHTSCAWWRGRPAAGPSPRKRVTNAERWGPRSLLERTWNSPVRSRLGFRVWYTIPRRELECSSQMTLFSDHPDRTSAIGLNWRRGFDAAERRFRLTDP
jgi:hypothetical protein